MDWTKIRFEYIRDLPGEVQKFPAIHGHSEHPEVDVIISGHTICITLVPDTICFGPRLGAFWSQTGPFFFFRCGTWRLLNVDEFRSLFLAVGFLFFVL